MQCVTPLVRLISLLLHLQTIDPLLPQYRNAATLDELEKVHMWVTPLPACLVVLPRTSMCHLPQMAEV